MLCRHEADVVQMDGSGYCENITVVCAPQEEEKIGAGRIGSIYSCVGWVTQQVKVRVKSCQDS
jgi:hypothetical protein